MAVPTNTGPATWKFIVEIAPTIGGHTLKASKPDADGYFDVVLAAIGVPTRSGLIYEPEPFLECMQSMQSKFNIMLRDGQLYGHCDHPEVRGKEDIPKLLDVRMEKASHHIRSVFAGPVLDNGARLICGKIKPFGPYKQELTENLLDPNMNTAFSLRSLCKEWVDNRDGRVHRAVKVLVTFDWVGAGGYEQAATRYAPSMESLAISVNAQDFMGGATGIAMENIGYSNEIAAAFGISKLELANELGMYQRGIGSRTFMDDSGTKRSLVHQMLLSK